MIQHLTDPERILLEWYRRLRVASYVGTAGELYRIVTGQGHPKERGGQA